MNIPWDERDVKIFLTSDHENTPIETLREGMAQTYEFIRSLTNRLELLKDDRAEVVYQRDALQADLVVLEGVMEEMNTELAVLRRAEVLRGSNGSYF